MNIPPRLSGENQEILDYLERALITMVKSGINGIQSRLRGGLGTILQDREELRRDLFEIEQLIDSISPSSPNPTLSRVLLGVWDGAKQEIDSLYKNIYIKHSSLLRASLANIQSLDMDYPTKYNPQIVYLDGIISSGKSGYQMIHFLIGLYYLCIDESDTASVLLCIQEYIAILGILPSFNMNEEDNKSRTPLMRIIGYQREIDELYAHKDLKIKRERIQKILQALSTILQDGITKIIFTPEQQLRAGGPENQILPVPQEGVIRTNTLYLVKGTLTQVPLEE